MKQFRVIWSRQSLSSVKEIYDYYKEKSLQGAGNVRRDLFNAPKAIQFPASSRLMKLTPNIAGS